MSSEVSVWKAGCIFKKLFKKQFCIENVGTRTSGWKDDNVSEVLAANMAATPQLWKSALRIRGHSCYTELMVLLEV